MPGAVTHLAAAYKFATLNLPATEHSMFYLGSIAPDAVSVDGFAEKKIRWAAHLRKSDLDLWEENVKNFYEDNVPLYDSGFIKGYVFHIITDIVWDKIYNPYLYKYLTIAGVKPDMLKTMRWNELFGYEESQLDCDWFVECVIPQLIASVPTDISSVSKLNIERLKVQVINKEFPKSEPPQFLSEQTMNSFYADVIKTAQTIIH